MEQKDFPLPLYEYQCKKCGHKFEKIQLFSDKPIKKCPECGGAVEKLISRSAVQFKGSGWYVTDYAKKSGGSSTSDSKSVDDSSASTASEKTAGKDGKTPAADSKESKPKARSESSSSDKKSHKK